MIFLYKIRKIFFKSFSCISQTSVTSMGIMLPVASSGAILMPWIIGIVAEKAGLAAGMASNIVPCVGLIIFTLLVAKLPEE